MSTELEDSPIRRFKGVWVPSEIWLDSTLSWMEKCVLAEIQSLSDDKHPCTAGNAYLAKMFDVSIGRMANIISSLTYLGWIIKVSPRNAPRLMRVKQLPQITKVVSPNNEKRELQLTESVNIDTSKDSSKKNTKTTVAFFEWDNLPASLNTQSFKDAWLLWEQHRKEIKCKLTPLSRKMLLNKLQTYGSDTAVAMINNAIEKGWRGVYETNETKAVVNADESAHLGKRIQRLHQLRNEALEANDTDEANRLVSEISKLEYKRKGKAQ